MGAQVTATLLAKTPGRLECSRLPLGESRLLLLGALAVLLALGGCSSGGEPPAPGTVVCTKAADCPEGFECIAQVEREDGLCFPLQQCRDAEDQCDGRDEDCNGVADDVIWAGAPCDSGRKGLCLTGARTCELGFETCVAAVTPVAEVCDGQDNDCDGTADEDFDFSSDSAHCGGCNNACPPGTACTLANCAEVNCRDGDDNDGDGFADCDDAKCAGRPCGMPGDGRVCALVEAPAPDGGTEPVMVPACVVP